MGFNLMEVFVKVGADTSDLESGLEKSKGLASGLGDALGGGMKLVGGAVAGATAAIGAATTAATAFGAQAVSAFADYEQLEGGVQKLYGESETAYKKMMDYAKQGYETAGMSMNQYMETATSFSASLISSLGGDLDKAADMTDVAMRVISDNVNTFGSDADSVSAAIMGLSKNNFMMLDNLKLGFSGSKEGMQQLIDKANELREANGEMGNLSIESFSDMITAIETVQEDLNIAGTTQREAMTTIEGSANATKAAWENVITAIGSGEGLDGAFDGLITSLFGTSDDTGLINQIVPRIQTVMSSMGDFIVNASPLIAEKIPPLIDAILPSLLDGGISLIGALGTGIISALPSLMITIGEAAKTIGSTLTDGMGAAADAMQNFDFATASQNIMSKIEAVFTGDGIHRFIENGMKLIGGLISGFGQALPTLIPTVIKIVYDLSVTIIKNAPYLIDAGIQLIIGLAQGIINAIPVAISGVTQCWTSIFEIFGTYGSKIWDKAKEIFSKVIDTVVTYISQLPTKLAYYAGRAVGEFVRFITELPSKASEVFTKVITAVVKFATDFVQKAPEMAKKFKDDLVQWLADLPNKMMEIGKNAVEGIKNGIESAWENLKSWIKEKINGLANIGESFANGFHAGPKNSASPSVKNALPIFDTTQEAITSVDNRENLNESVDGTDKLERLADAIVDAFVRADIGIELDNREFGRLIRKAVAY